MGAHAPSTHNLPSPLDGDKAGQGKAIAKTGDKIIHEGGQRSAEKQIEVVRSVSWIYMCI